MEVLIALLKESNENILCLKQYHIKSITEHYLLDQNSIEEKADQTVAEVMSLDML